MNAKQVLEFAKKNDVVMVDLRFTDWPGTWQHCSYPIEFIDEGTFEDGQGFDGSSIRGWQSIVFYFSLASIRLHPTSSFPWMLMDKRIT